MHQRIVRLAQLIIVNLILFTYGGRSAEFDNPTIKNFFKSDYKADNQNWSVAEDGDGNIFFANNNGLLAFDGITWKLYPLPSGNILRCVAVGQNNRVYSSGYRELGYWEKNNLGVLKYYSLTSYSEKYFTPNIEFWNIIPIGEKVYFHSFLQILVWDGHKMESVPLPSFSNSMSKIDGKIVLDLRDGLYRLDDLQLKPYLTGSFFSNKQIRFVFRDDSANLIIGTYSDGVFLYNGLNYKFYNADWNNYFIKNKVNRAALSSNNDLIIGTILDGIIAFNRDRELAFRFNRQKGLQNNTVLGIAIDRNQNIWNALDRGIDLVTFRGKTSYTLHRIENIGAVYAAAIFKGKFYLGTNQGLYAKKTDDPDENFTLIPQSEGQVWNCSIINDQLVIGHNNGTYIIVNEGLKKISEVSGAFAITNDLKKQGYYLQSTYSNLVAFDFTGKDPKWIHNLDNFNDLIQYIEVDNHGNIWAGHMHRGISRLKLSENRDKVVKSVYYGLDSPMKKDNGIHPFKVEDRIVFTTGEKIFTYDELKDSIVEYTDLNNHLGKFAGAKRIIPAPEHHYWLIDNESIGLFQIIDNHTTLIKQYPKTLFSNELIANFENIIPLTTYSALLCLESGYAVLNANEPDNGSKIGEKKLILKEFIATKLSGVSDTLNPDQNNYTLSYSHNNVLLRFAFPYYTTDQLVFRTYLEGIDPGWRPSVTVPVFKFDRLPSGKFTLNVKAIDPWGLESKTIKIGLEILAPWYYSAIARVGYLILIILLLVLFRFIIVQETRRKEHRKREEKEQELIRLRNEKLQDEISFKSQELANSTMSIIKKNEFLLDLKRLLKIQKNQLESRFPDKYYLQIVNKIDENIASQDDWKTFETNFERAHEEFIKKLKAEYPKLTPSDLRLCAYLRINLSSKEIAPLLGISVRGVENHRYRLRKKMELDIDANLNEIMMNLN